MNDYALQLRCLPENYLAVEIPEPCGPNSSEGLTQAPLAPWARRSGCAGALVLRENKPLRLFMQIQDCAGVKISSETPDFHEVHFEDLGSFQW